VDDDRGAVRRQAERDGAADPPNRAGDQRDLAGEGFHRAGAHDMPRLAARSISRAPIAHRHQMAIDEMQPAAPPPIEKELVRQGIEFRFVDYVEAAQGQLLAGAQHDARLVADEQPFGGERPHERRRRRVLGMELAAEADGVLQQLGRLTGGEERPLGALDDEPRFLVDTDHELAAAGLLDKDERIAANIGRNVDIRRPSSVVADEKVLGVDEADDGKRRYRLGKAEDDGIDAHRRGKLAAIEDDRVGAASEAVIGRRKQRLAAVELAAQDPRPAIEDRQIGACGSHALSYRRVDHCSASFRYLYFSVIANSALISPFCSRSRCMTTQGSSGRASCSAAKSCSAIGLRCSSRA